MIKSGKAMVIPAIGIATLVAVPTVAQTIAPADSAKATTVDRNNKAKLVVFAQESFRLDEGNRTLKVAAINTKGDTLGYNAIFCNLYEHFDETTTSVKLILI